MDNEENKAPYHKTSRAGMSIRSVDLNKIHKRLLNIFWRDVAALLKLSHNGKLAKHDAAILIDYLKLIKQLRLTEEEDAKHLSDDELRVLADEQAETEAEEEEE